MSAIAYIYKCENCGGKFEAPEVPEMSYGLFVMRTRDSQEAAFLDAYNDIVFQASYEIVKRNLQVVGLEAESLGEVQRAAFAVTCDKTFKGDAYQIGIPPKCPSCGSHQMERWEPVRPIRDWPLPNVEHRAWEASSTAERIAAIDNAIRQFLAIKSRK